MNQPTFNLNTRNPKPETVECLDQTFATDEARREHHLKLLAQKFKDTEFREIMGKVPTLKKQATEVICGFKPGNRNVSRTALRQEVVKTISHTWQNPSKLKFCFDGK